MTRYCLRKQNVLTWKESQGALAKGCAFIFLRGALFLHACEPGENLRMIIKLQ